VSISACGVSGNKADELRDRESYTSKLISTKNLIQSSPPAATALVRQAMAPYNLSENILEALSTQLGRSEEGQLDFIMKFTNEMQPPACNRAYISAITIALGYFVGGFIPLVPYFFADNVRTAFWWSVFVMVVALFTFGYLKRVMVESEESDYLSLRRRLAQRARSGVEMILLGGIAAGAAMGFVRALDP
jgi:vacuolar iron transporter family protein